MRVFVGIEIPEGIRSELARKAGELYKQEMFAGKVTEKENIHLTLKFFGEINEKQLEEVKEKLGEVKMNKFSVSFGRFGVFNENFVRIIWVHLLGAEELQEEIDEKLQKLFEKESRFMSHVTIARVKSVKDRKKLIEEVGELKLEEEFIVDRFSLIKSELKLDGPVYSVIEKYKLE